MIPVQPHHTDGRPDPAGTLNVLLEGMPFDIGNLKVNAFSVCSRYSWFVVPQWKLTFDMGCCVAPMHGVSRAFISHLHADHSMGLPMWIAWRQRYLSQGHPVVYVPGECVGQTRSLLASHAAAEGAEWHFEVVGLNERDRISIDGKLHVEAFQAHHNIPTIGFLVVERRRKLKKEHRGMADKEVAAAIDRGESVVEESDEPIFCYTSDTSPALFDRRPDLLRSRILVTECGDLDEGFSDEDAALERERYHMGIEGLSRKLEHFEGTSIAIGHIPARFTRTNVRMFLLPRLPQSIRYALSVMPYREMPREISAHPKPAPPLPEAVPIEIGAFAGWVVRERLGYVGARRDEIWSWIYKTYGQQATTAYLWESELIPRSSALQLYEDAYFQFLKANPEVLDWLVRTGADVYDNSLTNVESGIDYSVQEAAATHLQDIAMRRCILRTGRWFEGDCLIQIRGIESEGYVLMPGLVPFHFPDRIVQPSLAPAWARCGSIEDFWQSNKVVVSPP